MVLIATIRSLRARLYAPLAVPLGLVLLACAVPSARAQANAPTPNGPSAPVEDYPGPGTDQMQNDPINSLAYVNSNANSVQYVDREHGPLSVGLEFRTAYADNVFDSPTQSKAGMYMLAGMPLGYLHTTEVSRFTANYRVDGAIYPSHTDIDSVSQVYLHRYERSTSDLTNYFWDFTAGRVTSLGQYLPTLVPIGGTGVVQPTVGNSVLENSYKVSNAVTVVGVNHKYSERDFLSANITAGWLEEAQESHAAGVARQVLRDEPAGIDLKADHLLKPTTAVGVELTNLYMRGLAPVGHEDYTALEGTFRYNLTNYVGMRAEAGPLFNVSNSTTQAGSSKGFSYAASAAIDYNTIYSRISAEYSRVIQLQYLAPPTPAHQISAVFDRSISRQMDLTIDARFVHSDSGTGVVSQTNYGLTGRLDRYISRSLSVFITASRFSLSSPPSSGTPLSYGRDEVSAGIHYSLGAPLEREGPRR